MMEGLGLGDLAQDAGWCWNRATAVDMGMDRHLYDARLIGTGWV